MLTKNRTDGLRRTHPATSSGDAWRRVRSASQDVRLDLRLKPEHWLLAGVVCCALLVLSVVRVAAPGLAAQDHTAQTTPVNLQVSTGHELDRTGYVKGLYISRAALGNADFVKHIQDLLENTELNAVVMDFKGDRGQLTFPTQVARAQEIGADSEAVVKDPAAFLTWFKDRGVYTIARIPVSKDNLLAQAHPEWAVINANTGNIWRDPEKMGWVDPNHEAVWDYNIALAVEAAQMGFDEVQYDYVRFPTDGNVGVAQFSLPNTEENRTAAIAGLLQRTQAALKPLGAKLGVDTFGYASWVPDDVGIGQHIESIAPYVDVLSPMVYPSTFDTGLPGEAGRYRNAIAYPYEVVRKSTERTVASGRAPSTRRSRSGRGSRTSGTTLSTTAPILRAKSAPKWMARVKAAATAGCCGMRRFDTRVRHWGPPSRPIPRTWRAKYWPSLIATSRRKADRAVAHRRSYAPTWSGCWLAGSIR